MTKNALVWGAGGGIGSAITRKLAEEGWEVLAAGRHLDALAGNASQLLDADVDDPFSVQTAVTAASQQAEAIDLWIYAVGDITSAKVAETNPETWRRILDANLSGAFLTTHYSLPLLSDQAHLFYFGAVTDRIRTPGLSAYAAAKSGLESFADVVRKETRRRVTLVRPLAVKTALWEKVGMKVPPRAFSPEEIAERVYEAYQENLDGALDITP